MVFMFSLRRRRTVALTAFAPRAPGLTILNTLRQALFCTALS